MLRNLLKRTTNKRKRSPTHEKAASSEALEAKLDELGREWMYGFDLGHGVSVAPANDYLAHGHATRWRMIEPELHRTFGGRWQNTRVLDAACNEGWWSFRIAELGAREIVAFDARTFNINRAEFVKAQCGATNVQFRVDDVFHVDQPSYGDFDLTLCLGLLYHLEDPMGAIRRLYQVTRELLVIETEVARAGTITIDRGLVDGVVTTDHLLAVVPEAEFQGNSLASITGLSIVPTFATLHYMLGIAGFTDIQRAEPVPDGTDRHARGDRVVVFARRSEKS